jgi:hypothetical protein
MWWPFRIHIGSPSRKGEIPATFEFKKINVTPHDETRKTVDFDEGEIETLPSAEYPLFYYAFVFKRAGILSGIPSVGTEHDIFAWLTTML